MDLSSSTSQSKNEGGLSPESSSPVMEYIASQWQLFLVLGVAGLITAGSLNVYLWRCNRMLNLQYRQQTEQLKIMQQREDNLNLLIQDVVNFSAQHSDIRPILAKYLSAPPSPAPNMTPPAPLSTTNSSSKKKGS